MNETQQDGYKPIEYAQIPSFDQGAQFIVEGAITENDELIIVDYEVRELAIDETPTEIEHVSGEYVELPPHIESHLKDELTEEIKTLKRRQDESENAVMTLMEIQMMGGM